MVQVSDLNSAFRALNVIIEQGEGHDQHVEGSHYEIFHDLTKITGQIVCYPVVENPTTDAYKGEKLYEVQCHFLNAAHSQR
jgi:argonaute-like protein implicated in RNA metabolism and viral defense